MQMPFISDVRQGGSKICISCALLKHHVWWLNPASIPRMRPSLINPLHFPLTIFSPVAMTTVSLCTLVLKAGLVWLIDSNHLSQQEAGSAGFHTHAKVTFTKTLTHYLKLTHIRICNASNLPTVLWRSRSSDVISSFIQSRLSVCPKRGICEGALMECTQLYMYLGSVLKQSSLEQSFFFFFDGL